MFTDPKTILKNFGLTPGMIVADLGSGIGNFTIPIAKIIAPDGQVYAVDIHRDILTRLARDAKEHRLSNIQTIWGDLEEINGTHIKDESVDLVLFANVLHQVKDRPSAMREALRILRDGGKIAIVDWKNERIADPTKPKHLSLDQAKHLCDHFGLNLLSETSIADTHYGILFSK